ncbi:dienelactone hydrolase family protein [Robertkochia aurantiaca]|uniref:dienelactone hydrolase family protein n=1 Tax=Robertkochia aurantiaca TaxID=2873700 RepID=UPI001CCA81A0|nr:dienelactone hydrolase family protein [Robertkochia sp. 3YJGBD-33]
MSYLKRSSAILFLLTIFFTSCKEQPKNESEGDMNAQTKEVSVIGEDLTYRADTTQLKGYIAFDENATGKAPGILVVHEWWGHNEYARERAEMLAELGYVALAVDMYGNGKTADHPEKAQEFSGMVMQNIDVGRQRFEAAMEALKQHPRVNGEKIAAIGYCFGGSVVLTMANAGYDLDAVAAFHSGVQLPIMPTDSLTAKVLICNGAEDPFVTPESVAAYTRAMDSLGADYKYVAYENAQHSFTSKAADSLGKKFELPLSYNAEADEKSRSELKELLNRSF